MCFKESFEERNMEEELTILRSISLTIYGHPRDLLAAFRRFVIPNKEEKMGNYNDKHYDDDPFFDCDFPDLDTSEQRHCERCQDLADCELIPMHGYSEWLCRKCAATAYRVADAI